MTCCVIMIRRGAMTVTGERKFEKTTWVPDRDLGLGLREFLLIVEARSDRTIRSRLAPNRPQNEGCLRFELPAGHSRYSLLNASMSILSETQPKLPSGVWERQPGESLKAYNAFRIYRELKRDRSLAGVTAALARSKHREDALPGGTDTSQKRKSVKSGQVGLWSRKYNWKQRASEWDIQAEKYSKQRSAQSFLDLCDRHVEQMKWVGSLTFEVLGEFLRARKDGRDDFQTLSVEALFRIAIRAMRLMPALWKAEREAAGVKVIFPKEGGPPVWEIQSIEVQPRWENVEEPFWNENASFERTVEQLEAQTAELAGAEPWSQQPGESDRAYSAFCLYRDLGPARSLAQVTHCCRGTQTATASSGHHASGGSSSKRRKSGQVGAWSGKFAWMERCRRWDAYQAAVYERGQRNELERRAQERAEKARAALEVLLLPILQLARSVEQRKEEFGRMPASKLHLLFLRLCRHLPSLFKYERRAIGLKFVDPRKSQTSGSRRLTMANLR
jgi:hypothetical protein